MVWAVDAIDRAIPPDVLRTYLRQQPAYVSYRKRTAAGLQMGFDTWDTYLRWRPTIFWSSLIGALGSAAMLYGRRKQGPEAWGAWAASTVVNGTVAFLTRPTEATNAAAAAKDDPMGPNPVLAYLDEKALHYQQADPDFPDSTYRRLVNMPGMREQWQQLPELAKAAVV